MILDRWARLLMGYSSHIEVHRLALLQFSAIILSLSLKNYFALRANGFRGRRLFLAFLFDINALTVVFLLGFAVDRTILLVYVDNPTSVSEYYAHVVTVMMPLMLSVVVATPYVGPLFSWILWPLVFIGTFSLGHAVLPHLSIHHLLLATMPGLLIIFFGVAFLHRYQWAKAYGVIARSSNVLKS